MKPGTSDEEQQRHVERVAELHEPGRLVGRVDEEHAALEHRVVGRPRRRPRRPAGRSRRSARGPRAPGSRRSEPSSSRPLTYRRMSNACRSLAGTSAARSTVAGAATAGAAGGCCVPVRRQVGQVAPDHVERVGLGLAQEVPDAGLGAVHPGPAHRLQRGLLAGDHLDHPVGAEVHRGVAVDHRDHVAERRDVRAAGGATARTARRPAGSSRRRGPGCRRSCPAPRRPGNRSTWSVIRAPAESTR